MFTAAEQYGTGIPTYGVAAPTQQMATDASNIKSGVRGLVDFNNPLFIFGLIMAVTLGLAGAAGSVRVGKAKVSASVDKG